MELQFADSKTVSNCKGGKSSNVDVLFKITKGDRFHIWDWQISVDATRNGHSFYDSKQIRQNEDVYTVLNQMVQKVCADITGTYDKGGGCNVETGPIVDFVKASHAKFVEKMREAKI